MAANDRKWLVCGRGVGARPTTETVTARREAKRQPAPDPDRTFLYPSPVSIWVPVILAILAPIGVLIGGRNWPTLGRRVRDHAALIKDVPAELSAALRGLLTDEITELIRRDRRRLDPWLNRYSNALRGLALTVAAAAVGAIFVIPAFLIDAPPSGNSSDLDPVITFLSVPTAVITTASLALSIASRRRLRRVSRSLDEAQESSARMQEENDAQRASWRETARAQRQAQDAARRAGGLPPLRPSLPPLPPTADPRVGRRRPPLPPRVAGQRRRQAPQPD